MRFLRFGVAMLRTCLQLLFSVAGHRHALERHTRKLRSPYSFADTLARLHSTLEARGITVFATIDHQAGAHLVGLTMPPTTVLIYGNPKTGTPLMQAAPDFALELPLRVLVHEDTAGCTWLVYDTAASLEGRHGLPAGMAERLSPAEQILVEAIQTPPGG
ncbi:DUF302 domain-containing protein [Pseudomonas sp. ITA]|uniref:DUF302 domain-containing protein n=1 Tax=Pseudomonas sp. ITA TaxID=2825841 RepID=UPI002495A921|nr:DUF302 domain-containing protein [Pseudomonas sp. ITA]MDI2145882.1 DUF302 domain-containing protein [Pseudomonas sp. ITA]